MRFREKKLIFVMCWFHMAVWLYVWPYSPPHPPPPPPQEQEEGLFIFSISKQRENLVKIHASVPF
jgi:hypothetical protein